MRFTIKLRHKLLVSLAAICFLIIALSAVIIDPIEKSLHYYCKFHTPALSLSQQLAAQTYEAVEESMAYLLTGDEHEKNEFLHSAQDLDQTIARFKEIHQDDHPQEENAKFLLAMVERQQQNLFAIAGKLFSHYEASGLVDPILFHRYETIIDDQTSLLGRVIETEQQEANLAEQEASTIIKETDLTYMLIVAFTLSMVILLGLFITRYLTRPLEKLDAAIMAFGRGQAVNWQDLKFKGELNDLAKTFQIMAVTITAQTRELEENTKHLKKALSEVKSLQGILPICSYCKKIRDDAGYWNQLEVYIEKHSDADFSHSICPECYEERFAHLKPRKTINH